MVGFPDCGLTLPPTEYSTLHHRRKKRPPRLQPRRAKVATRDGIRLLPSPLGGPPVRSRRTRFLGALPSFGSGVGGGVLYGRGAGSRDGEASEATKRNPSCGTVKLFGETKWLLRKAERGATSAPSSHVEPREKAPVAKIPCRKRFPTETLTRSSATSASIFVGPSF